MHCGKWRGKLPRTYRGAQSLSQETWLQYMIRICIAARTLSQYIQSTLFQVCACAEFPGSGTGWDRANVLGQGARFTRKKFTCSILQQHGPSDERSGAKGLQQPADGAGEHVEGDGAVGLGQTRGPGPVERDRVLSLQIHTQLVRLYHSIDYLCCC